MAAQFDCDIDAPDAWDTFTGSSDIVVAVIDSGMALTHEDFMGNNRASEGNKQIKVFVNKKLGEELYEARDENYNIISCFITSPGCKRTKSFLSYGPNRIFLK